MSLLPRTRTSAPARGNLPGQGRILPRVLAKTLFETFEHMFRSFEYMFRSFEYMFKSFE